MTAASGLGAGIAGLPPPYRIEPISDRTETTQERRRAARASIQRTCGRVHQAEGMEFISSRRLRRTRLNRDGVPVSLSPDEKGKIIVRRIIGGPVASRFSRSHFHRRRRVGGIRQVRLDRRRIPRFGDAGNRGQEVVVTVGRQAGPRPSSRVPGTVVNHRGGESRRRFRRRNRRKSEMVGAVGFEPTTSTSRTLRATRLRYAPPNLIRGSESDAYSTRSSRTASSAGIE